MENTYKVCYCVHKSQHLFRTLGQLDSSSHFPTFFDARFNHTSHKLSLIYNRIFSLYFTLNILPILVAARYKL